MPNLRRSAALILAAGLAAAPSACAAHVDTATSVPRPATLTARVGAPVHRHRAALRYARTLARRAVLPPGAAPADRPPVAVLDRAPQLPEVSGPYLVDATSFAVSDEAPAAVAAFLAAHPPAGTGPSDLSGTSSGPSGVTTAYVGWPADATPAGVDSAEIIVTTARDGEGTALRVDAEVTWRPPKPPGLTVPRSDTVVVVTLGYEPGSAGAGDWRRLGLPAPRRVVVTEQATIRRLRRAADGLEPAVPGVTGCPADYGQFTAVAFAPGKGDQPNATFTIGGCGNVSVSVTGRSVAYLGDDVAFSDAVDRVLGVRR